MIVKIGSTDYSARVIAGSYNVQSIPVFSSWIDANGKEHRRTTRIGTKTQGSFDMFFRDIEEYNTFANNIKTSRLPDMTIPMSVYANNTNEPVSSFFFVDYNPVRNRGGNWKDYMERFTVSIEEA